MTGLERRIGELTLGEVLAAVRALETPLEMEQRLSREALHAAVRVELVARRLREVADLVEKTGDAGAGRDRLRNLLEFMDAVAAELATAH
jgi:hypothetical protein